MAIINRYEIGDAGEALIMAYYRSIGASVIKSDNPYDEQKDLLIDGIPTEVKTQTIYNYFPFPDGTAPAMTVPILGDTKLHRNQLNKCVNVDRLLFVSRPDKYNPTMKILECLKPRNFVIVKNKHDDRYVAGFSIAEMSVVKIIDDRSIYEAFK